MRYRVTVVYTPDDVDADRHRQVQVFDCDADDMVEVAVAGAAALQLPCSDDEVRSEAGDVIDAFDERFIAFEFFTNNGRHHVEIEPFDVAGDKAVTRENLLGWVRSRCSASDDGQVQSELAGILGRWTWWTTDWSSRSDLHEALHECRLNGCRGYSQMTIDELLDEIFDDSGLIEYQRDRYGELSKSRPFDMDTMIESDKALWLDE